MAKNLTTLYPGKTTVDAGNPNGTFKNRTSDALKDGTPYEKGWASDIWGFVSHILGLASVSPSGAEENETNSQYYDALEGLTGRRKVKFESDELIINFISSTQATASFKRLSLLDSNFIPKFLNDKVLTWTMPGDLEAGTSEKASHDYGMWVDSDEVLRLVPDLTGTTDSTVAGSIADSTAIFLTDLVHDGDIVYNLTTLQKTKASADAAAEGQFTLDDDIFTSGDDYKIVKMSPEGLGENRERVGAVFNNGSNDLDDSTYAQIQGKKRYSEVDLDFNVTGTNWTTAFAEIWISQSNDWTGLGKWGAEIILTGTYSSDTDAARALAWTGLVFRGPIQSLSVATSIMTSLGSDSNFCARVNPDNTVSLLLSSTFDKAGVWALTGPALLVRKPTFHN